MDDQLYLVIDDLKAHELYGDRSPRPYIRQGLPSSVPIFNGSRKKTRVSLRKPWFNFARVINILSGGYDAQFTKKRLFQKAIGWHNVGKGNVIEQVTFSGNIVKVYKIVGQRAYIRCFYNTEKPPAPRICLPDKLDPLIHLLTTQFWNKLDMTMNGNYPQTFVIATSRKQELWIDVKNLVKYK